MTMAAAKDVTFREFINTEMRSRDMSIRQFAQFVGVDHSTLVRLLDEKHNRTPSLEVMANISKATGVNLMTMISLLFPDASEISGEAWLIAQQVDRLPEAERRMITDSIVGALLRHKK
jgi:transcriptional regulator with XRE-family HTH domain